MSLRCFLATESVRGTKVSALGITNKGSLSDTGYNRIIPSIAAMGHKREFPSHGMGIVTMSFLF